MSRFLSEAFKKLELLEEEDFNLSAKDGIEDMSLFMDEDDADESITIIDADAENEEDLEDSYDGQVIFDCPVCHSKIFKKIDLVKIDDEEELANVGEECPYCYSAGGFKVIGQVAPFVSQDSIKVSVEDKDDDGEIEDDEVDVKVEEAFRKRYSKKKSLDESLSRDVRLDVSKQIHDIFTDLYEIDGFHPSEADFDKVIALAKKMLMTDEAFFDDDIDDFNESCSDWKKKAKKPILPGKKPVEGSLNEMAKDSQINYDSKVIIKPSQGTLKYLNDEDRQALKSLKGKTGTVTGMTWEPGNRGDRTRGHYLITVKVDDTGETWDLVAGDLVLTESLKEEFEKVELETEDQKIKIETEPKETRETEEQIIPITDTTEEEILDNSEEEIPEDAFEEAEVDVDEFDEESFDELGESYLKEVYKNIKSFKTTAIKENNNHLKIEGNITFKSGNVKPTSFLFEQSKALKNNRIKLIGENLNITKGKKAFNIVGNIKGNKLVCESLNYNYRAKDDQGNTTRLYGTVKRK